jgi:hypothetical protein
MTKVEVHIFVDGRSTPSVERIPNPKHLSMPTEVGKCENGSFKFLRDMIRKYI